MNHFTKKYWDVILGSLMGFILPIFSLFLATGAMVLADLATGVYASKKRGETICSKKMGSSISKCVFYFLAIILGHIMEVVFSQDIPIAKVIAGIICAVEFKSNLENITSITGVDFSKVLQQKMDAKRGLNSDEPKKD